MSPIDLLSNYYISWFHDVRFLAKPFNSKSDCYHFNTIHAHHFPHPQTVQIPMFDFHHAHHYLQLLHLNDRPFIAPHFDALNYSFDINFSFVIAFK